MSQGRKHTRRSVLDLGWRSVLAAGVAGSFPQVFEGRAQAASVGDRSAVCIYLLGGNDSNNLIVPYKQETYDVYAGVRGALAIPQAALLPVTSARQRDAFGFHPNTPEIQRLYSQGVLAVLANEGPLTRPITKAEIAQPGAVPAHVSDHTGGDDQVNYVRPGAAIPSWVVANQKTDEKDPRPQVFQFGGMAVMFPDRPEISGSEERNPSMITAMKSAPALRSAPFPNTSLGRQLLSVVKLLQVGPDAGWKNPAFSCTLSGFDTHRNELPKQAALFQDLSRSLFAFHEATQELGIAANVTTFTSTEFNRTLVPNNKLGTGHGWGGHQLILGGAVLGGDIYGQFPSLELNGPDDAGGGVLIPTSSSSQYHSTIASWYGCQVSAGPFSTMHLGFIA